MTDRDHWQQVYEAKAAEAVSWYQPEPSPSLAALERIGAGSNQSFIDVGGGASTLVDVLLERGWRDLTVLDIAGSALDAARARLGAEAEQVEWIAADITGWAPGRTYDVWHDRAVFHFLTEAEERIAYRAALLSGTQVGSHAIIATFAPDGPERCSGLPVRRYDAEALAAALDGAFALIEDWRETHVTPWGAEQPFQWCVLRRT